MLKMMKMKRRVITAVGLPTSLTVNAKVISLVGGDGRALAFTSGPRPNTTEVRLPAAGSIQITSTDAWVLKIAK